MNNIFAYTYTIILPDFIIKAMQLINIDKKKNFEPRILQNNTT